MYVLTEGGSAKCVLLRMGGGEGVKKVRFFAYVLNGWSLIENVS